MWDITREKKMKCIRAGKVSIFLFVFFFFIKMVK